MIRKVLLHIAKKIMVPDVLCTLSESTTTRDSVFQGHSCISHNSLLFLWLLD